MQVDHRYINTRRRPGRLREDQPRARLPEARRPAGARLRPLPAHRLRHLPRRAAAALPRGAEGPAVVEPLAHEHPGVIGALKNNVEMARGGSAARRAVGDPSRTPGSRTTSAAAICSACRSRTSWTAASSTHRSARRRPTSRPRSTSFLHPDVSLPIARERGGARAASRKQPKQPKLQRCADHDARAQRHDGDAASRATRRTSSALQGFHTVQLPAPIKANAPTHVLPDDFVYYDAVQRNAKEAAQQLAVAFGPHTVDRAAAAGVRAARAAGRQPARRSPSSARRSAASSSTRRRPIVATPVRSDADREQSIPAPRALVRDVRVEAAVPARWCRHAIESQLAVHVARPGPRLQADRRAHGARASRTSPAPATSTGRSMETDWTDAPILRHPTQHGDDRRPQVRPVHHRRQHPHGRAPPGRGELLGREHAARRAVERDDARDRQGPPAARRSRLPAVAKIGMFGAGYVGLVTGACFADLGHEVVIRDVIPERIERLRAGEVPIYEPGLELVLERNKDRHPLHARHRRGGRRRGLPLRRRRDAADGVRRRRPRSRLVGDRRASRPICRAVRSSS